MAKKDNGTELGGKVRELYERIDAQEEIKKEAAEDIKALKGAIRDATGFSAKAVSYVIGLRKLDAEEREEFEAEVDALKGLLGMLGGTPLGESAVSRYEEARKKKYPEDHAERDERHMKEEKSAPPPERHNDSVEVAREKGRAAGSAGVSVKLNPYPPHDPCRGAWDEGWVQASGLTGLEVPDAWKRPKADDDKKGAKKSGGTPSRRASDVDDENSDFETEGANA